VTDRVVIYGTGGMAREAVQLALDCARAGKGPTPIGFLDERTELHGSLLLGLPILGGAAWLTQDAAVSVLVGVGAPAARRRVVLELARVRAFHSPALVHPSAVLSDHVTLGAGSMICAGSILTTQVKVGAHVIVNLGCTISHDVALADYVTLACGVHLSGNVSAGEGADVGVGGNVIQGRAIGSWAVVGAGAAVVRDVPADSTAVGCPAKVIKQRSPGWHL
jgi:sugar O-acyltransferase (sialic acid O-acetyltransferase NeuD family)